MAKSKASAELIDDLVVRLREDIKFGAYDFGQRLKLSELQETYSASQFHVRQALAQLKAMKLVEHRHNYGFSICEQDPVGRNQLRQVRMTLERSAVPLIIARATAEDVVELGRLAEAFAGMIGTSGRQELAAANIAFHRYIYGVAGNRVLSDLINGLREQSYYATTGRWRSLEGINASSDDHFAMVGAIERRDPIELDRLIFLHIQAF
jgi:DNA-binding GntR family transcriptional regulator